MFLDLSKQTDAFIDCLIKAEGNEKNTYVNDTNKTILIELQSRSIIHTSTFFIDVPFTGYDYGICYVDLLDDQLPEDSEQINNNYNSNFNTYAFLFKEKNLSEINGEGKYISFNINVNNGFSVPFIKQSLFKIRSTSPLFTFNKTSEEVTKMLGEQDSILGDTNCYVPVFPNQSSIYVNNLTLTPFFPFDLIRLSESGERTFKSLYDSSVYRININSTQSINMCLGNSYKIISDSGDFSNFVENGMEKFRCYPNGESKYSTNYYTSFVPHNNARKQVSVADSVYGDRLDLSALTMLSRGFYEDTSAGRLGSVTLIPKNRRPEGGKIATHIKLSFNLFSYNNTEYVSDPLESNISIFKTEIEDVISTINEYFIILLNNNSSGLPILLNIYGIQDNVSNPTINFDQNSNIEYNPDIYVVAKNDESPLSEQNKIGDQDETETFVKLNSVIDEFITTKYSTEDYYSSIVEVKKNDGTTNLNAYKAVYNSDGVVLDEDSNSYGLENKTVWLFTVRLCW